MRNRARVAASSIVAVLLACSSSGDDTAAAPSGLTYSVNPAVYTVGIPVAANTPSSSGGAVVSYSVSPALPDGLSLNTSSGVISGTPTAVAATVAYTVTATNSGGTTTAGVSITVNPAVVPPSDLTYAANPAVYPVGTPIASNTPISSGGAVVSYAVSPALPAGLNFSTATGVISGTPTTPTVSATYTVTATNSAGSTTAGVTLTVSVVSAALSTQYVGRNGMTVALTSWVRVDAGSYYTYTASYTQTNNTNGRVDEGAVKLYFTNRTPMSQDGLLGTLMPGQSLSRSYSFELLYTEIPWILEYDGDNFFSTSPIPGSVQWDVTTGTPPGCVDDGHEPNNSAGIATKLGAILPPSTFRDLSANDDDWYEIEYPAPLSIVAPIALTLEAYGADGTAIVAFGSGSIQVPAGLHLLRVLRPQLDAGACGPAYSVTFTDATVIAPAELTYSVNSAVYHTSIPITPNLPSSTGDAVTLYSVTPPLPPGLTLDTVTGIISGTPTTATAPTPYTITATNPGGSSSATVNIAVTLNSLPTCSQISCSPIPNAMRIHAGDSVHFYAVCSDPDGDALTYLWSFGDVAPPSSAADAGLVTFPNTGTYDLSFGYSDGSVMLPYPCQITVE